MSFGGAGSCGGKAVGGYSGWDAGFIWYSHSFHSFDQLVDFFRFLEAVVAKGLNGSFLLDTVHSACFAVGIQEVILVVGCDINNKSGLGFIFDGSIRFPLMASFMEDS